MKKYLLFLLVHVCAIHVLIAADLTPSQIKLRNEIQAFLKEEGFMPEIDSDGDIRFKKEGNTYYVRVNPNDESPMYVSLFSPYNYSEKYDKDIVILASEKLNRYKGVKVVCYETSFSIQGDMFVVSSEAFKFTFYKIISQIVNIEDDLLKECSNVSSGATGGQTPSTLSNRIPFLITVMEVANTDKDGGIIQDFGKKIYDFKTQYLQPRITYTPFKTSGTYTVYIRLYKDGVLQTGQSSPKGYTYSHTITISGASNTTYTLPGWGSATSGNWKEGEYRFEVWYENYCLGSKSFTII